ncbi:MAG: CPXCG motif-containing cysteine-rich protein [Proteobacteria bacterium]|nr:CPXCG motif-containing cysteine-rich protein [Pseudomonadota bacterium]
MLNETKTVRACCPYCGEQITLVVDCSVDHQVYVEDCEVCCKPISIEATADEEGTVILSLMDADS